MEAAYAGGALAFVFFVLWAATRENEVFRLELYDTNPGRISDRIPGPEFDTRVDRDVARVRVVRGKVPPAFLADVRELTRQLRPPPNGLIRAVRQDGEPRLVFSSSFDERTAQKLRNAFALAHGQKRL